MGVMACLLSGGRGRLRAHLLFGGFGSGLVDLRYPEDDAAAGDRDQVELEGQAFALLVPPGGADAGPVLLGALLIDGKRSFPCALTRPV